MVDISNFIQALPIELQWEIGQHLNLYFPLSVESAKAIITKTNYQRYIEHALKRDNIEQLRIVLEVFSSNDEIQKYSENLTTRCAKFGAVECLQYLTEHGYHKHRDATWAAAENGHLACLRYLTEQGYHKHENGTWVAATYDHLTCLQYLTEQGYYKDQGATCLAARYGHLACLQYLTEQGYHKDEDATWIAAKNGHLACLQYCLDHEYPK